MLREGDQRSIVSGSEEGVLQELMDSASGKICLGHPIINYYKSMFILFPSVW